MTEKKQRSIKDAQVDFENRIGRKEARKLKAGRGNGNIWFGLGMFGLVGWAVAVPTLAGVALGLWIDHHYSSRFSWTLMLLAAGVLAGCWNAWYWISKEQERIRKHEEENHHE